MRKLMWLTLGFSGAVFCVTRWMWGGGVYPLAILGCLFLLAAGAGIRFSGLRVPAVVLLGAVLGYGWMMVQHGICYAPLAQLDDRLISGEILLTGYPEESAYGLQANATLNWQGRQYPVRVFLEPGVEAEPGNLLEGTFQIRLTLPGGSKESTVSAANRIYALLTPKEVSKIQSGRAGALRFLPQSLSRKMEEIVMDRVSEDVAAFARALLLGGSEGLDYAAKTALSVSGIRHIAAVSGLHVGILLGAIRLLLGKNRILTALVGIPVLFLFAAMVGFSPSVCRAGLMAGLFLLAPLLRREYDALTALSVAVLVLLLRNPFAVHGVGFALSVLSVLGILLFYPRLSGGGKKKECRTKKLGDRLLRYGRESLCLTVSAMSLSTPVSVYYFGRVSLLAPVTNLLCLGLVTVSFYGICLTCIVGVVSPPMAGILGGLTAVPLRLVLGIAKQISSFPLAALYTASPYTLVFLGFLYVLALAGGITRRFTWRRFGWAAGAALMVCVLLSALDARLDECRLTVLDVGQGQSLVLQSKGQTMVVDCGGRSEEEAANAAADYLLSRFLPSVRALALTHYDQDHSGGAAALLTRVKAEELLLPGGEGRTAFSGLGIPRKAVTEAVSLPLGEGTVHLFPYTGRDSAHENSMAILFETENCAILITGDLDEAGERALLRQADLPRIDVLVVGHHGASDATSQELLEKLRPKVAVISVGADNRYGHPARQTLERLESAGCRIFRTDQQGTILIRR